MLVPCWSVLCSLNNPLFSPNSLLIPVEIFHPPNHVYPSTLPARKYWLRQGQLASHKAHSVLFFFPFTTLLIVLLFVTGRMVIISTQTKWAVSESQVTLVKTNIEFVHLRWRVIWDYKCSDKRLFQLCYVVIQRKVTTVARMMKTEDMNRARQARFGSTFQFFRRLEVFTCKNSCWSSNVDLEPQIILK